MTLEGQLAELVEQRSRYLVELLLLTTNLMRNEAAIQALAAVSGALPKSEDSAPAPAASSGVHTDSATAPTSELE